MTNSKPTPNGQVVNVLNGDALRRYLHGKSEGGRAQLAAHLIRNRVSFSDLSAAQVARLVKAKIAATSAALSAAPVLAARNLAPSIASPKSMARTRC